MIVILPTAYLAPVSYYYYLINFDTVVEQHEHYRKQTLANHCHIATAHGIDTLTIPVEHTNHTPTHDVRISFHHDWQTLHWRALEAAYNASPFFDYYKDDLKPFYEQPTDNLLRWNTQLQNKILELLGFDIKHSFTNTYKKEYDNNAIDLRDAFTTKKNVVTLQPDYVLKPYYQVFEQKFGFLPDLSIIDLLFNMGNEARLILKTA
ncbi:MAG: WbqC family protein [Paludibacteraceae bacterium]